MFNHTKDIPFAAAMMGATLVLIRIARRLPSPRTADIAWFGLLTGAALGMRVVGLLTHASSLENVDVAIRDFVQPELAAWLSEQKMSVSR